MAFNCNLEYSWILKKNKMMCINHLEKAVPCYNMIINICTVQNLQEMCL